MNPEERLRRQSDFARVFDRGKSYVNQLAVLYVLPSGLGRCRVGFVVSKRFGTAASRNRVKRRYREALRRSWPELCPGYDLVVLPRRAGIGVDFAEIVDALRELLRQAGLLAAKGGDT